jgi:hypothetical protein
MSLQALTWAMYTTHDVDTISRFVLVVLADHAGPEDVAWPSRQRIADAMNASVDTVDRRLVRLAEAGLIEKLDDGDPRVPESFRSMRADRRTQPYLLLVTGPQSAAPYSPRGRSSAAPSASTGPQDSAHGAAAVRHEPKEPNEELRAGARARGLDRRPDSRRPHRTCGHIHPDDEPCPRTQPADVAHTGATRARQALAAATQGQP